MTLQMKFFWSTRQQNQTFTTTRSLWNYKTNKYRSTYNEASTPSLGSNGCSLCADLSIPTNLNAHVTDSQTCADVHMQLAMLRYDNAMCATGQEQYGELCCKASSQIGFKTALAFMVGALLSGFVLKNVVSRKSRRIREEQGATQNYCKDDLPGTVSFNSRNSRSGHAASRNRQVEMSSSCSYHKMEDHKTGRSHGNRLCENSGNRPVSRSKGRPSSRSRTPRVENNRANRPVSRSRDRNFQRDHRDNRPVSRAKDRSHPKDIIHRQRSKDRSYSTGRNRRRSHSRSRPTRDSVLPRHYSRDQFDRPVSRSRQRDTSRSRGRSKSRDRSRSAGTRRSQSRTRHRPQRYEVGKISSEDGIILSTQYHSSRSLSLDPSRATDRSRSLPSVDGVMLSQVV